MDREQKEEFLKSVGQLYGIHAIWLWNQQNIVRLQFNREHLEFVEFVEFEEVIPRIEKYFDEQVFKLPGQIEDLKSLPYVSIYTGTLEKPVQKSYILLSNVINLLNKRRRQLDGYKRSIAEIKKSFKFA